VIVPSDFIVAVKLNEYVQGGSLDPVAGPLTPPAKLPPVCEATSIIAEHVQPSVVAVPR
jgi:hypothetical protein